MTWKITIIVICFSWNLTQAQIVFFDNERTHIQDKSQVGISGFSVLDNYSAATFDGVTYEPIVFQPTIVFKYSLKKLTLRGLLAYHASIQNLSSLYAGQEYNAVRVRNISIRIGVSKNVLKANKLKLSYFGDFGYFHESYDHNIYDGDKIDAWRDPLTFSSGLAIERLICKNISLSLESNATLYSTLLFSKTFRTHKIKWTPVQLIALNVSF